VDPSREKDRVPSAGAALDRAAKDTAARAINRGQGPEHIVLDLDKSRVLGVAPSLAAVITGEGATEDLLLSKSRVRDHERHRPSEDRAAVPGLCQSLQVKEVALGQEMFLRLTLVRMWMIHATKLSNRKRKQRNLRKKRLEMPMPFC
jgi:hypothetical protein